MLRLFVALPLEAGLIDRLTALTRGLPGARWIEPHNLHLSLRFVGEVDEGLAEDIHDVLSALSAPAFSLTLEGFGTFGRRPHTLWAGVAPEPALVHLRDKIETALVRLGLPPEGHRFTPHVTLARLSGDKPRADQPTPGPDRIEAFLTHNSPFHAGPVPVDRFTLFQSHLSRNGSEYEALAEYPLHPAGTTSWRRSSAD